MLLGIHKGIVHPKFKIQSISTHPHSDGRSGEIFLSTKHYWSFTGKRAAVVIQAIVVNSDWDSNVKNT